MKLHEVHALVENARDSVALERIAAALSQWILDNQQEIINPPKEMRIKAPKISELVGSKVLGHLYNRLRAVGFNIRVVPDVAEGREVGGEYYPSSKSIMMYIPARAVDQEGKLKENFIRGRVESFIVHELRHALDRSLAGREGFNSATKGEYLQQTGEINARFTEVQKRINGELDKSIEQGNPFTFEEYVARFKYYAVERNLLDIFDKNNDKGIAAWMHYVDKGIFGNKFGSDQANMILQGVPNAGAFKLDDKRYKRLMSRLYAMYNHKMKAVK